MKLIMESWRDYLEEGQGELLEEGILDRIKGFFTKAPDVGSYRPDRPPSGGWPQNSYGAFAAANGVVAALEKVGAEQTASTIAQGFVAMTGMSTGGEKSAVMKVAGPVAGLGLAIAGTVAVPASVGTALTVGGIATAAAGLVQTLMKDPGKSKKFPVLQVFQLDPKYLEILDDNLEDQIEEAYQQHFVNKLKTSPEERMVSINKFTESWLAQQNANRTVTGSPDLTRA